MRQHHHSRGGARRLRDHDLGLCQLDLRAAQRLGPDILADPHDLDRMIVSHSLPVDTRLRVQRSLRILEQFPRIGRQLEGRWAPLRVILGPWRWMLIIYSYEEPDDVVLIVAFQDARSSAAATAP